MALTNYTDIAASVTEWLNRSGSSSVSDNMEDFFYLAQNRMFRELDINPIESVSTISVDAESENVPAGLTDVMSIWLVGTSVNTPLTRTTLDEVLKWQTGGNPCVFAHVGDTLYFGPTPTSAVDVRIHYHLKPTVASTTNATNWYTTNAPEVLLSAVLVEAYLFLKDDNRAQLWEGKYQQNKALLEMESWKQDASNRRVRDGVLENSNWSP
jgi:hypothetical protein